MKPKRMKYSKSKKDKPVWRQFTFNELFIALVLGIIIVIIPTVVRVYFVIPSSDELAVRLIHDNGTVNATIDAFAYYKSRLLLICGGLIVIFNAVCVITGDVKIQREDLKGPVFIASTVFVILAVLSSFFSNYRQLAFSGFSDRHESVFILVIYVIIFQTVKGFVKTGSHTRMILLFFLLSAFFIGTIGAFQAFGMDVFTSNIGKRWVLGDKYYEAYKDIFKAVYTKVYSTLFNPNCVGLYTSLLIPVFFLSALLFFKKTALKIIFFIATVLLIICAVGSGSQAGFLGLAGGISACFFVSLVYCAKFSDKKIHRALALYVPIFIVAVASIIVIMQRGRLSRLAVRYLNLDGSKQEFFVRDMEIIGSQARFYTANGDFFITAGGEDIFSVSTASGGRLSPVNVTSQPGNTLIDYNYHIPGIGDLFLQVKGNRGTMLVNGFWIYVYRVSEGEIAVLDVHSKIIDLSVKAPRIGFDNAERFASSRGYIWSRTLPVLPENIFIGSGPDSFAVVFPQHDIVGKIRNFGEAYVIVDKAHNYYLHTWVTTGMLSLIALLFIFIYYVVDSLKALLSGKAVDLSWFALSLGLFSGVCGYLVCSMSTDSTVSVAPLFWATLGLGFAVNKILRKAA